MAIRIESELLTVTYPALPDLAPACFPTHVWLFAHHAIAHWSSFCSWALLAHPFYSCSCYSLSLDVLSPVFPTDGPFFSFLSQLKYSLLREAFLNNGAKAVSLLQPWSLSTMTLCFSFRSLLEIIHFCLIFPVLQLGYKVHESEGY